MSRFPRPGRTPRPRPVPTAGPTPSPTPGPGTTFTLTTNIETVPATGTLPANSTVKGILNGATSTFQTGDTINGNATSKVQVDLVVSAPNLVSINDIGSVEFRNLSGAATNNTDTNAILWNNVGSFVSVQSTNTIGLQNGSINTVYGVKNSISGTADGVSVGLRAGSTGGTADTIKFAAENAGSSAGGATTRSTFTARGAGIEAISLATVGTNFVEVQTAGGVATTDYATLTISGVGGDVSVASNALAATSTINASSATGALTLDVNAGLTSNDTIRGGSSTADVLRATVNGTTATGVSVSGFETLSVDSGAAASIVAFATAPGFSNLNVAGAAPAVNALRTFLNTGAVSNLNFVGRGTVASVDSADEFSGVTLSGATSSALTVNFSNAGRTKGSGGAYTVDNLITTAGVASYVINVTDVASNAQTTTLNGITDASTTSIDVNSPGNVVFGTYTSARNTLVAVDFAGVTGLNAVSTISVANDSLAPASSIVAGAGGLEFTVAGAETATDVLTFAGAAGRDKLLVTGGAFAGLVVANGAGGNDSLQGGTNTDSLNGEAGDDTLEGGAGNDTLNGGTNDDRLAGGTAIDRLAGGTGVNTFVQDASTLGQAATAVAGLSGTSFSSATTITLGSGVDLITDFANVDRLDVITASQARNAFGLGSAGALSTSNLFLRGEFNPTTGVFAVGSAADVGADVLVAPSGIVDGFTNNTSLILLDNFAANLTDANFV